MTSYSDAKSRDFTPVWEAAIERELALLEREPVLPFRTSCRLRGGASAAEQFDSMFGNNYAYLMRKLIGPHRERDVPNEYDMQDMCNELDKLPPGGRRLSLSCELFNFVKAQITFVCLINEDWPYDRADHVVTKRDYKRFWVDYFANLRRQSERLKFGHQGTVRSPDQEHTIRAVWIYLMVIKAHTYETPLTRTDNATLVVRRTSLTPTDDA